MNCIHCDISSSDTRVIKSDRFGIVCRRHYLQLFRHGVIKDRTVYDKNEIVIDGEIAYIILADKSCKIVGEAIIDSCDVNKIKDTKWYMRKNGYVWGGTGKKVSLHSVLVEYEPPLVCDHIDGNPLNNMKSNLRVCIQSQNTKNTHRDGKIVGVNYNRHNGVMKWIPRIMVDYKSIWLGAYELYEDAVKARLEAEIKYFGEYAPQKHLYEQYGVSCQ